MNLAAGALDRAPGSPGLERTGARFALWKIWLIAALYLVAINLTRIYEFEFFDPDDYSRLLQVRDLLNGQPWFDTHQYRLNPPYGADMHWLRIADLPLAGIMWLTSQFLPQRAAETVAVTVLPLLQLAWAMVLIRGVMLRLGATATQVATACAMLAVIPFMAINFMPLRIDHHGWQALLALAATALLLRGDRRALFGAGLVGALLLGISLEGLLLLAIIGAWLAYGYVAGRRVGLAQFLAGLAIGSVAVSLAFRPISEFWQAYCDVLSGPHVAAFGLAATFALIAPLLPYQDKPLGRAAALLPIPLSAAATVLWPLGVCAVIPLANVSPIARAAYFDVFFEAAPITGQKASTIVMILHTGLLTVAGWLFVRRMDLSAELRDRWLDLAVVSAGASLVSVFVMRGLATAQLVAIPFMAIMVVHFVVKAQAIPMTAKRIAATLLVFGFAMPLLPSLATQPVNQPLTFEKLAEPYYTTSARCRYERLQSLPASTLFTPIGVAPALLVKTQHSAIVSTYHRDDRQIDDVFLAFTGPDAIARPIVQKYHANYIIACLSDVELAYLAGHREDALARRLIMGPTPGWLEPVAGFDKGNLRVYRVK